MSSQFQQMPVAADDVIRVAGNGAFEHSIVVRIFFHEFELDVWFNQFSGALNFCSDCQRIFVRHAEPATELLVQFIEEDGGNHQSHLSGNAEFDNQAGQAAKHQR